MSKILKTKMLASLKREAKACLNAGTVMRWNTVTKRLQAAGITVEVSSYTYTVDSFKTASGNPFNRKQKTAKDITIQISGEVHNFNTESNAGLSLTLFAANINTLTAFKNN